MPRFEKGSKEAIEWGKKMKEARDKKKQMKGGWLEPGENVGALKSSDANPVEDIIEGGKIKMGKVSKGLSKVGKAFSTASDAVNPISYAVKDKKLSNVMRKAGDFTQNYALPAVVQAGIPLYYGAAGTAGMMLGGPVGSVAATKGAQLLYDEMVGKKGYDPRERQKSKLLGNVATNMGRVGSSELKSDMKQPKAQGSGLTKKQKQLREIKMAREGKIRFIILKK